MTLDITKFQKTLELENGDKYIINILKGRDGIRLFNKLKNVLLPLIGGTIDGIKQEDVSFSKITTFSDLALILCDQLDKIDVEDTILTLLKDCQYEKKGDIPKTVNFDIHFAANYGELLTVLEFALKENFGSLFMGKGIHLRLMETVTKVMGSSPEE